MIINSPSRCLALAVLLVAGLTAGSEAKVGVTSTTAGEPVGTPPAQNERVLRVGTDVFASEAIRTSANDRAHLLFNDGTALTIGPSSQIIIDRYVYDPDRGTGTMLLTATRGVFRLVGGKITKSSEAEIRTPTGTIGIRGGITVFNVSAAKTEAYLLFGKSLTAKNANGQQIATRAGSKIETSAGQTPAAPRLATQQELAGVTGQLEAAPSTPGAPPAGTTGTATATPQAIERSAELSDVDTSNSNQPPAALSPSAAVTTKTTPTALVQEANATSTDTISRSSGQSFLTPPSVVTIGSQGRYIADPPYTSFSTTPTITAPRDPNNNTTLSSAVVINGSQLVVTTQTGATFTLPWSLNAGLALSSANTSSTFGPLSGFGLTSISGDFFAYVFAPDSNPDKIGGVFGGTPTPTSSLPISGFGAHILLSVQNNSFVSLTPFVSDNDAFRPAVAGAFNSPLLSLYSPNAHLAAIAGSPDPNQRAVAMQASLGIVGQGANQSSYFGLIRATYITDYTKPDAIVLAGAYQSSLRTSSTDLVIRMSSSASTMETQTGTAIYGPRADYMVLGPDGLLSAAVNDSVRTEAVAVKVFNSTANPIEAYYPVAIAVPALVPDGIGARRTTRAMNGYAGGNVEVRTFSTGAFSEYSVRNLDPVDVSVGTNASSNRVQATLRLLRTDDPARDVTLQLGTLVGNQRAAAVFIDDANFAMSQNPNASSTYDSGNAAVGRVFAVTQSTVPVTNFLPAGVAFCTCEYLSWGYWAGEVDYSVGPRAGERDRMHLATWVAGEISSVASIPTTGTATYNGHIIGNVTNGANRYLAAGAFQNGWNFGTRTGTVSVTNFDGTNYTGSASGPPASANFSGTIAGGGRSGSLNGSFFKSPTDPVKYQAGSFGITGPNYRATGIFAGQR